MKNKTIGKSQFIDRFMTWLIYLISFIALFILIGIIGYVFFQAAKGFQLKNLSFGPEGVGNQLFNTIYLVFLSLLISVPIGFGAGIYMAEYAKENKFTKMVRISIETLSSLPSIVIGLYGYLMFVVLVGVQWNMISGALTLAILNLPLITSVSEDALRSLPSSYRLGSYALGINKWQTVCTLLIPAALGRMMTGVILAAGRSFGEAAALLYTAGMSTDINWSNWNIFSSTCPLNPMRPSETLALQIWAARTEALSPHAADIANTASATLLTLVFLFGIGARFMVNRINEKKQGE